jgi:HK97 family phage major capsid protein
MGYTDYITRSGAGALIPEDVSRQIFSSLPGSSVVMAMARRMPNLTRAQQRIPVLSLLPEAYFVTGDTGIKQTSKIEWENKFFNVEELAVIVPISEAVLADTDYNIWDEARPRIEEAMGRAFDRAVLYGVNAPSSWDDCVVDAAEAAGHVVVEGTNADMYGDILGVGGLFDLVDQDGYDVNGAVAARGVRAKLRDLRDANGLPIFNRFVQDRTRYELDGVPVEFPSNGAMEAVRGNLIVGDFRQLLWTIRDDISFKMFTEGVITNSQGEVVHNLMQQDMVAMRVTFRVAWALPNPVNSVNPDKTTRYPFAVLKPTA